MFYFSNNAIRRVIFWLAHFIFLVPGAVQNLQVTSVSSTSTSLDVSWQLPTDGCTPGEFTLTVQLTNIGQCSTVTTGQAVVTTSNLSYRVTYLEPYSTYKVSVTPRNGAGNGMTSEVSGLTGQTGDCDLFRFFLFRFVKF